MKLLFPSLIIFISAILIYTPYFPHIKTQLATNLRLQSLESLLRRPLTNSTTTASTHPLSIPFTSPSFFAPRLAHNMTTQPRKVARSFLATSQSEGAGARVRRSIGTPSLRHLSPFLMLDHFTISPGAGFPDHPHRGQETITYLLEGAVDHEDFAGNAGTIYPGDLQFMTAGRGIVHAEMPNQGFGTNVGMQLWVDLPRELKGCEPRYRDLRAAEIPRAEADGGRVRVKVISGRSHGVDSVQELAYTPVWLLDVEVAPGGRVRQELPKGWNAFAYTLEGEAAFGEGEEKAVVGRFHNVVFEQEGDVVVVEVDEKAAEGARFSKSFDEAVSWLDGGDY